MKLQIQKSTKEADLIKACKQQDARAQRELYEAYAPLMLGMCRRYVKGELEAEDVMIKGFMKVFTKIDLFEGKEQFELLKLLAFQPSVVLVATVLFCILAS